MRSHPMYGSQSRYISALVFCLQAKESTPIHLINMQATPVLAQALDSPFVLLALLLRAPVHKHVYGISGNKLPGLRNLFSSCCSGSPGDTIKTKTMSAIALLLAASQIWSQVHVAKDTTWFGHMEGIKLELTWKPSLWGLALMAPKGAVVAAKPESSVNCPIRLWCPHPIAMTSLTRCT